MSPTNLTVGGSPDPSSISTGIDLTNEIVLNMERNLARRLGNSERLERCHNVKHFASARSEWFGAWCLFYQRHGLASVLDIRAGQQQTLKAAKTFTLAMLRLGDQPKETLQKQASLIYAAACEGDVDFFRNIGHAFRGHDRARREGAPLDLDWCILSYWFAGLLWLMSAEEGSRALCEYLKTHSTNPSRSVVTIAAYTKVCSRLKLKGYKAFTRMPPVLAYYPKAKTYDYASGWTHLEPELSRC
jgi:hypothetical protein